MQTHPIPTPPQLSRSSSSSSSSSPSLEKLPLSFPPSSLSLPLTQCQCQPTAHPASNPQETRAYNYTRAPELYFPDGNLILRADRVLFRVYAGLLAARSSVFRDMLGFPRPVRGVGSGAGEGSEEGGQGDDGDTWIDGCPVVQVYDDPKELGVFLRAVFDSSSFAPPPSPTTLATLTAILRLSLKYDIPYLTTRSLQHLHTTFPTTLAGWKARDAARTIPPVDNTPFAVLRVAREFDLVWVVPSVVYCIASHPVGKTVDGAEWGGAGDFGEGEGEADADADAAAASRTWDEDDDDEEGDQSTSPSSPFKQDKPKPKPEHIDLPWADKKMCIRARQRILMAQAEFAHSLVEGGVSRGCERARERAQVQAVGDDATNANGNAANGNDTAVTINFHNNPPAPAPANPAPANAPTPTTDPDPAPEPNPCTLHIQRLSDLIKRWDMAGLLDYFEADDQVQTQDDGYNGVGENGVNGVGANGVGANGGGANGVGVNGVGAHGNATGTSHALSGLCPPCRKEFLHRWREGCRGMWGDLAWVCGFGKDGTGAGAGAAGNGGEGGNGGTGNGNGGTGTGNGWEALERERRRAMMSA